MITLCVGNEGPVATEVVGRAECHTFPGYSGGFVQCGNAVCIALECSGFQKGGDEHTDHKNGAECKNGPRKPGFAIYKSREASGNRCNQYGTGQRYVRQRGNEVKPALFACNEQRKNPREAAGKEEEN